jgi:glycogen operon protein
MGWRLTGSADLYGEDGRSPYNSINFITCHDGFTLNDLVSYNGKHNGANAEENRDGTNDNQSWNCGAEGETDDPAIRKLRAQLIKNHICHLLFSSGTPMVLGGDEFRRTQRGNNNAYCQDNEISWSDWRLTPRQEELLRYTIRLVEIRRNNPVLRRRSFFGGRPTADGAKDVTWLRSDGNEMTDADWHDPENHVLGMLIDGRATDEIDARGRPIEGDTPLLALNGGRSARIFRLPKREAQGVWSELVRTASAERRVLRRDAIHLPAHSLALLRYGEMHRLKRQEKRGESR